MFDKEELQTLYDALNEAIDAIWDNLATASDMDLEEDEWFAQREAKASAYEALRSKIHPLMPTVVYTTQPCQVCGKRTEFTLDAERVERWMKGGLIQNVFPEMTPAERETLISGTHGPCWDKLMGGYE